MIGRCGLPRTVERTQVGFMGCHAAVNALKLARNIVGANPDARVLTLNLELCSLRACSLPSGEGLQIGGHALRNPGTERGQGIRISGVRL